MNRAVTVEPAYDADGNYVDSVVRGHANDAATDHTGQSKGWQNDYYEDAQGNTHHVFENVSLEDETSPQGFDFDDYQSSLLQSIPNLYDAIDWAVESPSISQEERDAYNQAVDNEDLSGIHAFIERLMPLYEQALAEEGYQETDEEPSEEETDLTDEEFYEQLDAEGLIDQNLDYLMDEDFSLTEEEADRLDSIRYAFDEGTPEHSIAVCGAQVLNGEITMEEAIDLVTQEFGDVAATKAYFNLQQLLNN